MNVLINGIIKSGHPDGLKRILLTKVLGVYNDASKVTPSEALISISLTVPSPSPSDCTLTPIPAFVFLQYV